MDYQLAQLNIARFRVPQDDPVNADFVNALDRVNAIAEAQPGFVWRLTGDGNDAMDIRAFDDPQMAVNLSVWSDIDALSNFVYQEDSHLSLMRRRREWFDRMQMHLVLWWVEAGHRPTIDEALERLDRLRNDGPSASAFTFRETFPPPD